MEKPDLKDPRSLYYRGEFSNSAGKTPGLQEEMTLLPDCGEKTYVGHGKLKNRRVLITGGDSGIGRAVAIAFAREGAHVAIQFLPEEQADAKEVAKLITEAGSKCLLLPYNFKDKTIFQEMIEKVVQAFGGLDTLVLNAAQQIAQRKIEDLSYEQVQETFTVNIISMFALVKAALPHLVAGSSIVTTTSAQAFNPSENLLDYAATKAAIANFTVSLAKQLSSKGIRVNGVAPGPIWTPLQLNQGQLPGQLKNFGQESLLGRAGQPVELAPVYVFLASNEASFVTAQIYGVTGGKVINL